MMGAFRLNPFAVHNGVKVTLGGPISDSLFVDEEKVGRGGRGGKSGKEKEKDDGPCLTWLGEEVGPLKEEPVMLEWQLDGWMTEDADAGDEDVMMVVDGDEQDVKPSLSSVTSRHSHSPQHPLRRSARHRASMSTSAVAGSASMHPGTSTALLSPASLLASASTSTSPLVDSPEPLLYTLQEEPGEDFRWPHNSTSSASSSGSSSLSLSSRHLHHHSHHSHTGTGNSLPFSTDMNDVHAGDLSAGVPMHFDDFGSPSSSSYTSQTQRRVGSGGQQMYGAPSSASAMIMTPAEGLRWSSGMSVDVGAFSKSLY